MDMPEEIKSYQIALVGNTFVGKTHLFTKLAWERLPKVIHSNIGVEYGKKEYQLENNQIINLKFWDTAGQERYKQISLNHIKKVQGIYLVYDITRKESFNNLEVWLNDVRSLTDPNVVIMLIGNKFDKVANDDKLRDVSIEQAQTFAEIHKLIFMEVSAYSNEDIQKCLTTMVQEILKDDQTCQK